MDNLAKVLVIVPLAVIGAVLAPRAMSWYGESRLAEEFAPALVTFDAMISKSDVKDGILPWGKKSSSIPAEELPTISGGIFIMRPSHPIYRRRGVEERKPASIDPSFFELDKSLRAASVSAIRTVVHVTLIPITSKYQEKRGGATLAILNLMVARL